MTKEDILAMGAGQELDALVAKEIMGMETSRLGTSYQFVWVSPPGSWSPPALYSTDILAAWEVVENLIEITMHMNLAGYWRVFIGDVRTSSKPIWADGATAPEAICKAALIAELGKRRKE